MDKLERYVVACDAPPAENLVWRLYGAGLDALGAGGQMERQAMPQPAPDEVLVRVDASGICASDFKVMSLGAGHRLLQGRGLGQNPLVLGHEVSVTVVAAGENYRQTYSKGQRFSVLPGIYYRGALFAIGYVLDGGFQQYMLLGKEILEGDDGAYLAPLRQKDGYCASAMIEPWSCVVAAYHVQPRSVLKPGGTSWFVGFAPRQNFTDLRQIVAAETPPARIFVSDVPAALENDLKALCLEMNVDFHKVGREELVARKSHYAPGGFDDILCLGLPAGDFLERLSGREYLAGHGVLCLLAEKALPRPVRFNTQRPHYDEAFILGAAGGSFAAAYTCREGGSRLVPGGSAVIVGAGGPMGRMHVQLAVGAKQGPALLVVCDADAQRLAALVERYGPAMEKQSRHIVAVNPAACAGDAALHDEIRALNGGMGYSDIIICAPVGGLVPQYFPLLAEDGVLNIFAGILKDYEVEIDLSAVWQKCQRILGSCGIVYDDFFHTLRMLQSGELDTDSAVAAICGIRDARRALDLVMKGAFLGKTVIYPALADLPLMTLEELAANYPTVKAAMKENKYWCKEAEQALFAACLAEGE